MAPLAQSVQYVFENEYRVYGLRVALVTVPFEAIGVQQ